MKKFIRPKAASELLGIPLSSLYDKMTADPSFPRPIHYAERAVAFDAEELLRWQLDKIATRNNLTGSDRERWIENQVVREIALQQRVDAEKQQKPRGAPRGMHVKKQGEAEAA